MYCQQLEVSVLRFNYTHLSRSHVHSLIHKCLVLRGAFLDPKALCQGPVCIFPKPGLQQGQRHLQDLWSSGAFDVSTLYSDNDPSFPAGSGVRTRQTPISGHVSFAFSIWVIISAVGKERHDGDPRRYQPRQWQRLDEHQA